MSARGSGHVLTSLAIIPHPPLTPSRATFPIYLHLGRYTIHPHLFFESLSYFIAFARLSRPPPPLRRSHRHPIPLGRRSPPPSPEPPSAPSSSSGSKTRNSPRTTCTTPLTSSAAKPSSAPSPSASSTVELIKRYIGLRHFHRRPLRHPPRPRHRHRTHRMLPHRPFRQHLRHPHQSPLGH